MIAAVALAMAGAAVGGWLLRRPRLHPRNFFASKSSPPEGGRFASDTEHQGMALSPDGGKLVFAASGKDSINRLWLRTLTEPSIRQLGTEQGHYPFWSPDGKSIGFFNNGIAIGFSLLRTVMANFLPLPLPGVRLREQNPHH